MSKVLVVRFSSIGDIVLTTPVVRALASAGHVVHFATKANFEPVLRANPYISQLHLLKDSLAHLLLELKEEHFDFIVDLHNNLRTKVLKLALGLPSSSFNKLNVEKYRLVRFKDLKAMPAVHIVDRYLQTLSPLRIDSFDNQGLDFFLTTADRPSPQVYTPLSNNFVAIVLGAQHSTKQLPSQKLSELLTAIPSPKVLLGAQKDDELAKLALKHLPQNQKALILNLCGKLTLRESAWVLSEANEVFSHDTGLMHIAAALKKPVTAIWGNTVPELGMYPYKTPYRNWQVTNLDCRPCSKIGFSKCPQVHFNCMNLQSFTKERFTETFS